MHIRSTIAVAMILLAVPSVVTASHKPKHRTAGPENGAFSLEVGQPMFWDGPFIERSGSAPRTPEPACDSPAAVMQACAVGATPLISWAPSNLSDHDPLCGVEHLCLDYRLDLLERGDRLRVALDHPSSRDWFGLRLYDPAGTLVGAADNHSGSYSNQIEANSPAVGCCWTVRVSAFDVQGSGFRMRALLDADEEPAAEPRTLLPNLQITPPFDIGFGDCQAAETAAYSATRCLRFSAGPLNVGDGALDLRAHEPGLAGTMHQRIHRSDGTWDEREAGRFTWHAQHAHYHGDFFADIRLFRVLGPHTGELVQAGSGPKVGICPIDHVIANWDSFEQDPQASSRVAPPESCNPLGPHPSAGIQMSITKGWGDIYDWYFEGNFVEFGSNPDGLYVLRVATDPDDDFVELNDADNHAYALLRVEDNDVEVLERGRGMSPWDPVRTLVADGRRAERM